MMWSMCELPDWAFTDTCRVQTFLFGWRASHTGFSDLTSHRVFNSLDSLFSVASIPPLRPLSFQGRLKSPAKMNLTLSPSLSISSITSRRATSRGSLVSWLDMRRAVCACQEVLCAHGIYNEMMANLIPFLPWRTTPVNLFHPLESCIKFDCLHFITLDTIWPLTSTPTPSALPKCGALDHAYAIRCPSANPLAWRSAAVCWSGSCSLVSCIAAELIFNSCSLLQRDVPAFVLSTNTWPFTFRDAKYCFPSDGGISISSPLQLW